MKFIKVLRFDLKEGILKNKSVMVFPVVIAVTSFFYFYRKVNRLIEMQVITKGSVTSSDFFMCTYGGMKEYIPESGNAFLFPMLWLLIFIVIPFLLVNYPFKDMQGIGQQVLVRSTGRSLWWRSKCCWNVIATLLYHGILLGTLLVLCVIMKVPVSENLNMDLQAAVFEITQEEQFLKCTTLPIVVVMLPILISVALNVFQMLLSFYIKPIFAFLVIAVGIVSSSYLFTGYMIGNYAMVLRLGWICKRGVSVQTGYLVAAAVLVSSVLIGKIRFRHYDILNRE